MNKYLYRSMWLVIFYAMLIGIGTAQTTPANGGKSTFGQNTTVIEEPVRLETPSGNLYGTLLLPKSNKKMPAVLIVAGSGPTDRDGNSTMLPGPNNSLKLLAEGLAAQGIASLRYDKRGMGEGAKEMFLAAQKANKTLREEDLRFDAFIDDAVLWGQKLRGDKRFSALTIIGHSEGSLIGMVAAKRMGVEAYISIAGAGRAIGPVIIEQLRSQVSTDLVRSADNIVDHLVAGKTVDSVPSELNAVLRPSIQPFMISWLRYDPAKEIAGLNIPVLITQGTTDIHVTRRDVELLSNANPSAKVFLVDGMNHVLKSVSRDREKQVVSYSDPKLPVTPGLIDEIARFISNIGVRKNVVR